MLRAIGDSGFGLEDWLTRVELSLSGNVPGRFAHEGDPSGPFAGETVVFTGKLEVPRGIAAAAAVKMGCNVADSITERTTILVVGDQDLRRTKGSAKSSKHRKAEDLIVAGATIRIVGESDFMLMVGQDSIADATPKRPDRNYEAPAGVRELVVTLTPEASRIEMLVQRVQQLKRDGDYADALHLLHEEITSQERESLRAGCGASYRQILVTAGPVRRRRLWAGGRSAWR
jgi:hypothetical protein